MQKMSYIIWKKETEYSCEYFRMSYYVNIFNQATLSYNGNVTTSNITTGELLEVISATKTALIDTYTSNDNVTYIINIINSGTTVYPLTYVKGSARYYVYGIRQTDPSAAVNPELTFTGINVPAGGNATLIYEASVNQYAPLSAGGTITNTATITGTGITKDIQVSETITAADRAMLTISKSLCPTTVTENGQLTYTFVIQNLGNTAATATDNVAVADTFNPTLNSLNVTFNGTQWSSPTEYSYNNLSGAFATVPGQVTVPAATYTQDATTGAWTVNPGVSVLTITGII